MSDTIYAGLTKSLPPLDVTFLFEQSSRDPTARLNDIARHAPLVFHVACTLSVQIYSS